MAGHGFNGAMSDCDFIDELNNEDEESGSVVSRKPKRSDQRREAQAVCPHCGLLITGARVEGSGQKRRADNVGEQLLAELVGEVRLLRLAMQGEVAGDVPPTDETYLLLSQLEKFAPASKKTLKKWTLLTDDPMPFTRCPGDGAISVQWGAFKKWFHGRQAAAAEPDDTVGAEARGIVLSLAKEVR